MSWNYRIIDFGTHVALHEVHYDSAGNPKSHTVEPATFVADPGEVEDVQRAVRQALNDATNRPMLAVADFGFEQTAT